MSETLDCPFCGSSMIGICDEESQEHRLWFVRCADCCASTGHYCDRDDALKAWNIRAEVKP